MPSRIIRESALTSPSLFKLSDFAERLWWRLTVVADDHGRFDADPEVVRSNCFPRGPERYTTDHIQAALQECYKIGGIKRYRVGGRTYGLFVNWTTYQRPARYKSKFPDPPQRIISANSGRNRPVAEESRLGYRVLGIGNGEVIREKREGRREERGTERETRPQSSLSLSQQERERKEIEAKYRQWKEKGH